MIGVNLIKINTKNTEDQLFLYEILKFRWSKKETINIKHKCSDHFPSLEDHIKHINSGKYKVFYKILFGEIVIGTIYIDKQDVNGTILLSNKIKIAFKKYKGEDLEVNYKPISAIIHIKLFELHPEIEVHYASVNPNNFLSIKALLENGYEHIESILSITTKNGKVQQGKWKNEY
jgi:hypothetical protein